MGVGAEGFDVEADGEALLGAGEVDEGGADDAVEGGVGVVEGFGAAGEAAEELLGVVEGGEEGAVAPEDVDVAGEAGGILVGFGGEIEVEVEMFELFGGEGPGVAFGGEDGRAGGVEGAEGLHERRVVFGLGEMVEVVGVLAQVDEVGTV